MTDETYEGWTNYETWGAALVLNNDQGTQSYVYERLASIKFDAPSHHNVALKPQIWTEQQAIRYEFADFLKDFVEDLCGLEEDPGPTLMARQLLQGAIGSVDFDQIASNMISDTSEVSSA